MSETSEAATRRFPPPEELAAKANVGPDVYEEAARDRLAFWEKQARRLTWEKEWDQVLDWSNPPFAQWFVGGKLNVAYNCLDRHVEAGHGDQVAYHWEGEPGDTRTITYAELTAEVCKAANALLELGGQGGDRRARARGAGRRPGRHLPADDPRDDHRDARLRADRRGPHGCLRRL